MTETVQKDVKLQPKDLADFQGQLFARNLTNSQIIYDQDGRRMELGPKGSISDAAYLSVEIARTTGFQRIWRRNMVEVISGDTFEEHVVAQEESARKVEEEKHNDILAKLEEPPAKRDLVQTTDEYGDIAFETEGDRENRERTSVPTVIGRTEDGEEITTETRVTIEPVMRGEGA